MTLTSLTMAAQVRREHDRRTARAIIDGVESGCPFPVVLYWQADPMALAVRAAGVTLARVESHELAHRSHDTAILYIVNRALLGYAALEPLPHDHPLGQD